MEQTLSLSIIVPCYNERLSIESTLASLSKLVFEEHDFEIVFVDDGSTDGTGELLDELVENLERVRVYHHATNRGYGAALKTGVRRARGPLIAITDADGTYPVERLPDLFSSALDADMVIGARTGENVTYSRIRKIPKVFLRRYISWIVRQDVPDFNSGLRIFRKSIAEKYIRLLPDGFSFTTTITISMLLDIHRVIFLPIDYTSRTGKSKIRPIRDTLRFIQIIVRTGLYFAPLRVLFPLILVLALLFVASLVYDIFVAHNLTDKTVMLLLSTMNTAIFGLLADMIEKRTTR